MTVAELIELLQQEEPTRQVHFAYNYGDRWHTIVAPAADTVERGFVVHSDYHRMDKLVDDDEADLDTADMVVVIR